MGILDSLSGGLGNLFGEKGKPGGSGLLALPDYANKAYEDLVTRTQQASNSPTAFAPQPFNTAQNDALKFFAGGQQVPIFNFGQQANSAFGDARNYLSNATGYLNDASGNISSGVNPITGEEIGTNIGYFMNPFEDTVVQNATRDINRQGDRDLNNIAALSALAGAFGGSRQAIGESEARRNTAQQVADTSGQLRYAGFNDASTKALQKLNDERSRFLQGANLNIGQAGTSVNQGQAATQLGNSLIDARTANMAANRQGALDQLTAGEYQNNQTTAQNQIPLEQLKFLASILGTLPGTQQTASAPNPGFLGRAADLYNTVGQGTAAFARAAGAGA